MVQKLSFPLTQQCCMNRIRTKSDAHSRHSDWTKKVNGGKKRYFFFTCMSCSRSRFLSSWALSSKETPYNQSRFIAINCRTRPPTRSTIRLASPSSIVFPVAGFVTSPVAPAARRSCSLKYAALRNDTASSWWRSSTTTGVASRDQAPLFLLSCVSVSVSLMTNTSLTMLASAHIFALS